MVLSHTSEKKQFEAHTAFSYFGKEKKKKNKSWREKEGGKSGQAEIADQILYLNYLHHSECKLLLVKA